MAAEVDIEELARVRYAGAIALIDVRRRDEYEEFHVPGAVLIPLDELPDRLHELPPVSPLYIICRTGARSGVAADFLAEQQIEAINIAGGTLAWMRAGNDVVTGADPT
ncbi:MAG TPA: rhodanese-like domain-containing protein [Acidimicrobiales bacterium]|nr:rhodanese-like domain-containing protein [Acidimicrobiales bacterium]